MRSPISSLVLSLLVALRSRDRDDRGDVPGWVLITLMTAALVLVLWGLASESFAGLWERAMAMVDGIG